MKQAKESNGKRHGTQQSLNAAVKSICDIMRRSNVAGAMSNESIDTTHVYRGGDGSSPEGGGKKLGASRPHPDFVALEGEWKTTERAARESKAKALAIKDAVYDLKAVNPNCPDTEDKRTPAELLAFIDEKGREADAALARLSALVSNQR